MISVIQEQLALTYWLRVEMISCLTCASASRKNVSVSDRCMGNERKYSDVISGTRANLLQDGPCKLLDPLCLR